MKELVSEWKKDNSNIRLKIIYYYEFINNKLLIISKISLRVGSFYIPSKTIYLLNLNPFSEIKLLFGQIIAWKDSFFKQIEKIPSLAISSFFTDLYTNSSSIIFYSNFYHIFQTKIWFCI